MLKAHSQVISHIKIFMPRYIRRSYNTAIMNEKHLILWHSSGQTSR